MIDKAQQQAILHVHGPCLTIAGPGAGKTHVLTRRIAYLTESLLIPPGQILVITFTRAAATEMRRRYLSEVPPEFGGVTFGTFHSIFFSFLRERTHLSHQSILDSRTKKYILNEACKKARVDPSRYPDFWDHISGEISKVKNLDISLRDFEPQNISNKEFQILYTHYEEMKRQLERIDFDDMQSLVRELFLNKPETLEYYRKRFKFFLVDEAQDMNSIQYELLKMLSTKPYNLFLVGDDDQAIYSFRGARPELFLGFTKDFPQAKVVALNTNYRCDKSIVNAGLKVIANNQTRYDKMLHSASSFEGKISFMPFGTIREEAVAIAHRISAEKQKNPDKSIAVLYRTHARNEYLIKELKKLGLTGSVKQTKQGLKDEPCVVDILSYFSAAQNHDRESVLRIMNRPERYISRSGLYDEIVNFDKWASAQIDAGAANRIRMLKDDLIRISKLPAAAALRYILHAIGYMDHAKKCGIYDDALMTKLIGISRLYPDKNRFAREIEKSGNEAAEPENAQKETAVYCHTFHGSKGLEFDHVYIVDANEGITPSRRARGNEQIEEERRMFYVAMTRAKHELTIAAIMRMGNEELYPSRFVQEITDSVKLTEQA